MWDFLFGKDKNQYNAEYDKAIRDTKQQRAEAEYNYHYNKALYDANKDYFDSIGAKDPSETYWNDKGQKVNALTDTMNQYGDYLNKLSSEWDEVSKRNKYNIFGDGLIGGLLNPFNQAGTAVQDLVTSGSKEWDSGNRDVLSDLGAIGESALMLAPFVGSGVKALKGAGAVAKGVGTASRLGKVGNAVKSFATAHPALTKVGGTALGMGGWSGLGALTDYGSDIGEHIPETALRVGMGTTLGALTGGVGYGINKLANKAQASRGLSNLYQQYLGQQKTNAVTDSAKLLGDGLGGATSVYSATPQNATGEWLLNRGNLAKTKLGQAIQGIGDTISYNNMMGNSIGSKVKNVASKVSKSKAGNKVANLLKTKKGKVIAGAGGGLLLSQLMKNNNNSNSGQLSDEEMQELYNYIYGGGQ